MKNSGIITLVAVGMLALSLAACEISSTNEDPNRATTARTQNLLTHAQVNLVYGFGGDISQYNSVLMQQMAGTERIHLDVSRYNFSSGIAGAVWDRNLYSGGMNNLHILINQATEEEAFHHRGVAKIMMAYALGQTSSLWNNIPYTEAFQGSANTAPAYDSGEDIYGIVQDLLTEGIEDLGRTPNPRFVLGNEDVIYRGDRQRWIRAARALSARFHNHLSKIDPQGSANAVLDALNAGAIASNVDNMRIEFGGEASDANPWHNHETSAFGTNTMLGEFYVDLLLSIDDPRLPFFAATNSDGDYVGSPAGSAVTDRGEFSELGSYYASTDGPFNFITYAEVEFIRAEAHYRLSQFNNAATAMNNAIIASLEDVTGTADPDYVAAQASEDATSIQAGGFERLMTHKYVALFLEPEVFSDWRRTGIPNLTPANPNLTNDVIPRRWPYPANEIATNAANVQAASQGGASITDRVWWDVP